MDEGSHKDFKKRCGGGMIKFNPENNTLTVMVRSKSEQGNFQPRVEVGKS